MAGHQVQEAFVMPLSVTKRQAVLRELAGQYRRARKHKRSRLIDQVQTFCGYTNRSYAARALATADPRSQRAPRAGRGRKPRYGPAAKTALLRCWAILNFPTGKRLPHLVAQLERHGKLALEPAVREQLLAMSATSSDRFLAAERRRLD